MGHWALKAVMSFWTSRSVHQPSPKMAFLLLVKSNWKTSSKTWAHRWLRKLLPRPTIRRVTVPRLQPFWLAIVNEGLKSVAAGMNPMDLKRGIDKATAAVVASLKEQSQPCATAKPSHRLVPSLPTLMKQWAASLQKQWKK